jgi:hypothetical protein
VNRRVFVLMLSLLRVCCCLFGVVVGNSRESVLDLCPQRKAEVAFCEARLPSRPTVCPVVCKLLHT